MSIRVMTFNVRVLASDDGPNQWMYRRDAAGAMLRSQKVDLLGLQEPMKQQLDDVLERLPDFVHVGISRMGAAKAEFSPILYRKDRFEVTDSGTFWLAEKDEPVLGWDAAYVRIATWAKLIDRQSNRSLLMLNTHLDHKGDVARTEGAKLIKQRLGSISGGLPIILTGDFNAGLESGAYRAMIQEPLPLKDARLSSRDGHTGAIETFPGFLPNERIPRLLDYIFVSPDFEVMRTETLPDCYEGRQCSDHRALMTDVELR